MTWIYKKTNTLTSETNGESWSESSECVEEIFNEVTGQSFVLKNQSNLAVLIFHMNRMEKENFKLKEENLDLKTIIKNEPF